MVLVMKETIQAFWRLLIVIGAAVPVSYLLASQWMASYALIHTVLEVLCLIIALASFAVVWYVNEIRRTNLMLGFGFLAAAVFDVLYIIFWQGLTIFPAGFYDLSARYWLAGRFIGAIFLVLSTTAVGKYPINRWVGLMLTVSIACILGAVFYYSPHSFPLLLTPAGATPVKILLEYAVVFLLLCFLWRIYKGYLKEDAVTQKYLIVAAAVAVPAGLCFAMSTATTDFYNVLGHILKISYYYYFLRAVFAAFIILPYKQLEISQERFHKVFHFNPSMMMIAALDNGVILDVNESYAQAVGIPREEIIGRTTADVNLTDIGDIAAFGGSFCNKELSYRNRAGEHRTVLASADTVMLENTPCMLTVATDVTDKTLLAKEKSRLERLNLAGEIAASIGHEVRNPMTTVRGYLQLWQNKKQFAGYHEQISTMVEELDKVNAIITKFLSLAKNKATEMKRGNLNAVIRALRPLLEAEALRRGHNLTFKLGDIPDSNFNEQEIRQMLLNLVRNAFEAMEDPGKITIRTYQRGNAILLSVRDTGTGFPAEILDNLGTPFITTKENGTGLGLPVCYRIADRHGATIELDTSPCGTAVSIVFKQDTEGELAKCSLERSADKAPALIGLQAQTG